MSRSRQLSLPYWVALGALGLIGVFWVTDLVYDWAPKWLALAAIIAVLAVNVFTFRMLWKNSDRPGFHRDGEEPPAA